MSAINRPQQRETPTNELSTYRMTFSLLVGSLLDFEASEGASPLVVVLEACKDVSSAS